MVTRSGSWCCRWFRWEFVVFGLRFAEQVVGGVFLLGGVAVVDGVGCGDLSFAPGLAANGSRCSGSWCAVGAGRGFALRAPGCGGGPGEAFVGSHGAPS